MARLTPLVLCCVLVPALSGCAVLEKIANLGRGPHAMAEASPIDARMRPVSPTVPLAPPDPAAAVDRLYDRAAQAIEARDYALALDLLQLAAQRAPSDVRVLNAQGVVYDKLGRFDLSGRYYARALKVDPSSPIVAHNMAYSARLQGLASDGPIQLAGGPPETSSAGARR